MTLDRARPDLPAGLLSWVCRSLSIASEEQMLATLNGELAQAGRSCCEFTAESRRSGARTAAAALPRTWPEAACSSAAPGSSIRRWRKRATFRSMCCKRSPAILMCGGAGNLIECLKFLSDRLLLTGHGYRDPAPMPEHGVYLRDIEGADVGRLAEAGRPGQTRGRDSVLSRASVERQHRLHRCAWRKRSAARGLEPLCIFTSSLKDSANDGVPCTRLSSIRRAIASVIISTLSFAQGEVNTGGITRRWIERERAGTTGRSGDSNHGGKRAASFVGDFRRAG